MSDPKTVDKEETVFRPKMVLDSPLDETEDGAPKSRRGSTTEGESMVDVTVRRPVGVDDLGDLEDSVVGREGEVSEGVADVRLEEDPRKGRRRRDLGAENSSQFWDSVVGDLRGFSGDS